MSLSIMLIVIALAAAAIVGAGLAWAFTALGTPEDVV